MSHQTDRKKLLDLYSRRLQKLKEQEAIKGIDTPPQILLEIEDLQAKIETLQEMMEGASSDSLTQPFPSINVEQELARLQQPEPPASAPAHYFDMRDTRIKAGVVNQGGEQSFHAPLNIDLSETTTFSEKQHDPHEAGELSSSDSTGAAINLEARLTQVNQIIGALPMGQSEKDHLIAPIDDLKQHLAQLPASQVKEVEKIIKRIEALAEELNAPEPDKEIVEMTAHSLQRAAKKLAEVVPAAPPLTAQITECVLRLTG